MKKAKDTPDENDILARLHDRVGKAIATIQELRRERDALKTRLAQAESGASERVASLEEDCERYQKERDEIRNRIESILANLESLDA